MTRLLPTLLLLAACTGGTTATMTDVGSPDETAATGDTGATGLVADLTCDHALDCGDTCPTWDETTSNAYGYASIAVDCADGGHALLQDNLFGTHAFFDAAGALVARQHFSDVVEFCYETQGSYWEGDPVSCEPVCAHGGAPASAYPISGELPDCGGA